jgi:Alw26I/Eco31I/Esp3I family type II restriction m6 adenine DNA methyltransferase
VQHLSAIQGQPAAKSLHTKATGRFYTPEAIGRPLAEEMVRHLNPGSGRITVMDPFCGDGRLVVWLLEAAAAAGVHPSVWAARLWDIDDSAVRAAVANVNAAASRLGVDVEVAGEAGDSFARGAVTPADVDALITNPPWERLKPDRREHDDLVPGSLDQYLDDLRNFDRQLAAWYPLSGPAKKFSGWGTNLARVGTEMSLRLTTPGGVTGVVSPPSLLGDQDSLALRRHLLVNFDMKSVDYFPAEARLFDGVDQPAITFVAVNEAPRRGAVVRATVFGVQGEHLHEASLPLHPDQLAASGYYLPTGFGVQAADLIARLGEHPAFASLETPTALWAGRELDETGYASFVRPEGEHPFIKGRSIERWTVDEHTTQFVDTSVRRVPTSAAHPRIAWRDVSRPNQKRRVQAALIPRGWVTGNSLSVAFFRDDDLVKLSALLAVVNSLAFEFQVRARLATGHVSLGTVRQVGVPDGAIDRHGPELARLAARRLAGDLAAEDEIEVRVAQLYGLSLGDFERIVSCFPKVTLAERESIATRWRAPATHLRLAG